MSKNTNESELAPKQPQYWFPAKRYGWGWGVPRTWQGWVVIAAWFGLTALGCIFLLRHVELFLAYTFLLSVALVLVCWFKGEPPRWRWGGD